MLLGTCSYSSAELGADRCPLLTVRDHNMTPAVAIANQLSLLVAPKGR